MYSLLTLFNYICKVNVIRFSLLRCSVMDCALFADDDYQTLVDKYATVRKDFETHMTLSCKVSIKLQVCCRLISSFGVMLYSV